MIRNRIGSVAKTSITRNRNFLNIPKRPIISHNINGVQSLRFQSNFVKSLKKTFLGRTLYYSTVAIGVTTSVCATLLAGFFIYDATTYNNNDEPAEIDVSSLAVNPIVGGPKNLPILYSKLDENDSAEKQRNANKPKLVILGSGWGSVSLLKELDPEAYDVTLISPTNYFLFTPMLPCATVGTLEFRSLIEPIRRICSKVCAHFLEGKAQKVEFSEKLVEVHSNDPHSGEIRAFYVPYDKLVVGVGSVTNDHGVDGLENCLFLKTVQDARNIRNKIVSNLETACLPSTSFEEKKRLLSFVVCGGGPTGVELAAEIYDMLNEDLKHQYPNAIKKMVSVHIIQSRGHILNTYDEKISEYAMERFAKDSIDVLVNSRVQQVLEDRVLFSQNDADGNKHTKELPFGMCVWSTGVSQAPITKQITSELDVQTNKRAIETDAHLRVIGAPMGDVYAIGDCSTVRTDTVKDAMAHLRKFIIGTRKYTLAGESNINNVDLKNISLTYSEVEQLTYKLKKQNPQAAEHFARLRELFKDFDTDKSGTLSLDELEAMLENIDKKVTSLPATAQRAAQQGQYMGRKLTRIAKSHETLYMNDITEGDVDDALYRPFKYHHLGSLAYVSNAAVFDIQGKSFVGGLVAMYLWRSVYFAQTVSFRTRALMVMDWLKRGLFGRDLADISRDENSN